jgi:hypothetical protein
MKTTTRKISSVLFVAASIAVFSTPLTAKTPDGETPATETVCNTYQGIPGAYGLCVAICEAQDLDEFYKNPPSDQLEDNFVNKAGSNLRCGSPEF